MEDALERWRSEKTAAYLSGTVAAYEPDPAKAHLFREMAHAAEEQAAILAKDLEPVPAFAPSLRSCATASLIRIFGPRAMKPVLSASKVRGVSVYGGAQFGDARFIRLNFGTQRSRLQEALKRIKSASRPSPRG